MTAREYVTLVTDNAAVDAYILGKDDAALAFSTGEGIPLGQIAAIADGVKDVPLLTTPGLGFAGAPTNAQIKGGIDVKEQVLSVGGFVSKHPAFHGFAEFYHRCTERGIQIIITDKDGVIVDGDTKYGREFQELIAQRGPRVLVLTGSSAGQNFYPEKPGKSSFMQMYGLDEVLAENGAVHVFRHGDGYRTVNYSYTLQPDLLAILKGPFEKQVRRKLPEILVHYSLRLSEDYGDQNGAVFIPPVGSQWEKVAMFSINVPRKTADGSLEYRKLPEAERFRQDVLSLMIETASDIGMSYRAPQRESF